MTTLVTGGTGFLGAYLLYYLHREGHSLKALKRANSTFDHLELVFSYLAEQEGRSAIEGKAMLDAIEWIDAELMDTENLRSALEGIDTIYHSAAKVSFNPRERESIMAANVEGTANLVNLAVEEGVSYFYHISSVSSLNRQANEWVDEQMGQFPKSFPTVYAESKFRSEREVWRGFAEGLSGLIVNPAVTIGPGHWDRGAGSLFKQVHKGMPFYPPGGNAYVDARDVVECLFKLRDTPEAYENRFVVVGETIPMKTMMTWIAESLGAKPPRYRANLAMSLGVAYIEGGKTFFTGKPPLVTPDLARMGINTFYYDTTKLHNHIDHTFRSIQDAVKETCECLLEHNLPEGV